MYFRGISWPQQRSTETQPHPRLGHYSTTTQLWFATTQPLLAIHKSATTRPLATARLSTTAYRSLSQHLTAYHRLITAISKVFEFRAFFIGISK